MTACLSQIHRHPIKGHGRDTLASVRLSAAECLPMDRHWAVAYDAALMSQLDAASGTVIAGGPVALGDAWSLQ